MKRCSNGKGKAGQVDVLIGKRLAYYRKLRRYSQSRLGEEVGITFQQIQKYENGNNRISASMLLLLSRVLNVPITELYGEDYGYMSGEYLFRIPAAKIRLIDTIINSNDRKLDHFIESFGKLLYDMTGKNKRPKDA